VSDSNTLIKPPLEIRDSLSKLGLWVSREDLISTLGLVGCSSLDAREKQKLCSALDCRKRGGIPTYEIAAILVLHYYYFFNVFNNLFFYKYFKLFDLNYMPKKIVLC
jgi:hypothetical protein